MKKLTLSADEEVIAAAKKMAHEQNTSVSALFGRFVRSLTTKKRTKRSIGPIGRRATGIISPQSVKNYEETLADALSEKYKL